jgi:hypothetical protein
MPWERIWRDAPGETPPFEVRAERAGAVSYSEAARLAGQSRTWLTQRINERKIGEVTFEGKVMVDLHSFNAYLASIGGPRSAQERRLERGEGTPYEMMLYYDRRQAEQEQAWAEAGSWPTPTERRAPDSQSEDLLARYQRLYGG